MTLDRALGQGPFLMGGSIVEGKSAVDIEQGISFPLKHQAA